MKIAVTGATGFVGQHVMREIACRSVDATAVLRSLAESSLTVKNVAVEGMNLHHPPSDVFERLGKPDVLLHLAWDGLPNYQSLRHFEEELPAQYRFLKGLVRAGLRNLVVTGTCFEYGMLSGSLREDMETCPATPYGCAKDTLRRQLEFLKQESPFNLTWVRLFFLYGEGQATGSLFPQLMAAVERGDPVFQMSGGEQLRDYLHVEAAAKYLVALTMAGADAGIVNVCSGRPISVRKLVETWVKDNDWPITTNLGFHPYPSHEPMAFWGDRNKLDRCLGHP